MDLERPRGIYRANSLTRLNVCDHIATPRAQETLEANRAEFGRPVQHTLLYHHARLIEMIYACERCLELVSDEAITDTHLRNRASPRAGRGIGCLEAPRGTLIHDYETDGSGCIAKVSIIVGTAHNIAPMNMSLRQTAASLIRDGIYDEGLLNTIEMAVRAYDPCISCATHHVDSEPPLTVAIVGSDGRLLASLPPRE